MRYIAADKHSGLVEISATKVEAEGYDVMPTDEFLEKLDTLKESDWILCHADTDTVDELERNYGVLML